MPSSSEELYPPSGHAAFSFLDLYQVYVDCRRRKRRTASALQFELHQERNLVELYEELISGAYRPGRSICFIIKHPKPREVWAADFRDRIVHHLFYNFVGPRFEPGFIADSCACIEGRGTLYAVQRLESKVRSITENWSKPAFYLKCDLANFFVSIDKGVVWSLLARRIPEPWLLELSHRILFHDPRLNYEYRGDLSAMALVPTYKRLTCQPDNQGLPIGNLSSQFLANVLLNSLDQHVKHHIRARHYVRYVDDFIVLGHSPQWLNAVHHDVREFMPAELNLRLNDSKTILQPIERGVDFVGQVIKPWRRSIRRRVVTHALQQISRVAPERLMSVANSHLGLLRQSPKSHRDRCRLARVILRRGRMVDGAMTKTYKPREYA